MQHPDLDDARDKAEQVAASTPYRWFVRGGLVAFGIVHLLIAYLAVHLAFGKTSEEASQTGALRELASAPFGPVLLWGVSGGMFAITVWQLLTAFVGHRRLSGTSQARARATSVGRAVIYAALGWNAASIAMGGSGGDGGGAASAMLLSLPLGRVLVGLVGIGVGIVGGGLILNAIRDKYEQELEGSLGAPQRWIARFGHFGKGVAIVVVGGLFVWAAWTYDAQSAGGLDKALQTVRRASFGFVILLAIALGFACYGAYCFSWARRARFHDGA